MARRRSLIVLLLVPLLLAFAMERAANSLAERERVLVGPAEVDFVTLQAAAGIPAPRQEPA